MEYTRGPFKFFKNLETKWNKRNVDRDKKNCLGYGNIASMTKVERTEERKKMNWRKGMWIWERKVKRKGYIYVGKKKGKHSFMEGMRKNGLITWVKYKEETEP